MKIFVMISIQSLRSGYNFYDEARKLAELVIIENRILTMPIDGRGIMRKLGIPSGTKLGTLLALAQSFYEAQYKGVYLAHAVVFINGLICALLFYFTGSLIPAIIAQAIYNLGIGIYFIKSS